MLKNYLVGQVVYTAMCYENGCMLMMEPYLKWDKIILGGLVETNTVVNG